MVTIVRIELDDNERRALNAHYGSKGLATRKTVQSWVKALTHAAMQDVVVDYARERQATEDRHED